MLVCGLSDGLVCVLDLRSSRVVRCVNVGRRVTAVEVVSGGGGGGGGAAGGRLLSEEVGRTLFKTILMYILGKLIAVLCRS